MFTHKFFTVANNLLGLNFFEQEVSLGFVLFLHLAINVYHLVHHYFAYTTNNPKNKPIYVFIDFIQLTWPLIIQNFMMIKAIRMRFFDKIFDEKTQQLYDPSQVSRNQKKYFKYLLVCISILIVKVCLAANFISLLYNVANIIPTITCSAGDFLFAYHMNCLSDYIKQTRESKCDLRQGVLNIIEIQHKIYSRHSMNLALSISAYFILIILALFWIFIRIVFHYFNTIQGRVLKI